MKNLFSKILILSFILVLASTNTTTAQNYFSKPEATRNLSDAAKYLKTTLPQMEESDPAMYKVNKEKLRFIKSMLRALKTSDSVSQAADKILPKEELYVLQPSVRFIDTSFANTTRNRYIRNEVMFLISY